MVLVLFNSGVEGVSIEASFVLCRGGGEWPIEFVASTAMLLFLRKGAVGICVYEWSLIRSRRSIGAHRSWSGL